MAEIIRSVSWEGLEHRHIEKTSDWYWALGIVAIAAATASIIFGNVLFGIVILLGATSMMLVARREPRTINYEVSQRGIRVENTLYPYGELDSFCIDEECCDGPQLLVRSKHLFALLLIVPIPEEFTHDIDDILSIKLPEELIHEPLAHRLLEFFGF